MGKKRRRVTSSKFATKFASKYAKFKAAIEEAISITAGTYEEVVEERKEVDESATPEPKLKPRSRKISPRKKSSDSKKKVIRKTTSKRKPSKKK